MGGSLSGKFKGVRLDSFLQMAQMERLTCTFTVTAGDEVGYIYLLKGELISAETGELKNLDAAYRLIGMDEADIEIQNSCKKTENQINQPMMNILMEGLRLKDEAPEKPVPVVSDSGNEKKQRKEAAEPKEKARFKITRTWKFILLGLVFLLVAGGVTGTYLVTSARQKQNAYENLLAEVGAAETSEQKIKLLRAYLGSNPSTSYAGKAKTKIHALKDTILTNQYEKLIKETEAYIKTGAFKEAIAAYDRFQGMNPGNKYTKTIAAKKKKCADRIETRDFDIMLENASVQGPEKIQKFKAFLDQYPNSRYQKKVLDLIAGMENEYYLFLASQIRENKKFEDWEECIRLSQKFIDIYPKSKHVEILKLFQENCQERIQANTKFEQLVQEADGHGRDWESALAVFSNYLKAVPYTPVKEKIQSKINRLKDLMEADRLSTALEDMKTLLAGSQTRFKVLNESFKDKKTGLTWSLLDSRAEVNKCLSYDQASSYVEALKTDGHEDWRLPSPKEMATLYNKKPGFPLSSQWYWTSRSFKRYLDQWIIDVDVIMPTSAGDTEQIQKESWECGAVRAVRGK